MVRLRITLKKKTQFFGLFPEISQNKWHKTLQNAHCPMKNFIINIDWTTYAEAQSILGYSSVSAIYHIGWKMVAILKDDHKNGIYLGMWKIHCIIPYRQFRHQANIKSSWHFALPFGCQILSDS